MKPAACRQLSQTASLILYVTHLSLMYSPRRALLSAIGHHTVMFLWTMHCYHFSTHLLCAVYASMSQWRMSACLSIVPVLWDACPEWTSVHFKILQKLDWQLSSPQLKTASNSSMHHSHCQWPLHNHVLLQSLCDCDYRQVTQPLLEPDDPYNTTQRI